MSDQSISLPSIDANLAPDAFQRWAKHYYLARLTFESPDPFSPVPYFLLCRAIELGLKAAYLVDRSQDVKELFGHDVARAYDRLPATLKILDLSEEEVLKTASEIYKGKGFEYFDAADALTGFKRYPPLDVLDRVARKLTHDI